MEDNPINFFSTTKQKVARYEKIIEVSTWAIVIAIIFGIQLIPKSTVNEAEGYLLIGAVVGFALLYYLVLYKLFSRTKRIYIKNLADIVFIGLLIVVLKDWGQFFYALFFLPIAAAALSLEFINALLIAVVACFFVIFEVILGSKGLMNPSGNVYQGFWQIGLILLITIFCRLLAVQLRHERFAREESLARQKALEEEKKLYQEFLSMTSHQLFTPLSMIRGFSSMLDDETLGKLNPKAQEAAHEIYNNSKRMINLVDELLSISYIQSGKMELHKIDVDISDIIQDCVNQFRKASPKKDVEIDFQKPVNFLKTAIDQDKIRQVIYNLIDNALKCTKKGIIKITCQKKDEGITVIVQDEGIGINEGDFEKLFQPFFRGKNILELDNKGTGLGLYISKMIVEKHGGKIWAESKGENLGATFTFSLPASLNQKSEIRNPKQYLNSKN